MRSLDCLTQRRLPSLPKGLRWKPSVVFGLAFFLWLASSVASSHIIMGTRSLHLRVAEADLIVRARVVNPDALFVSADGATRRELVEIEVLEILKGDANDATRIRFAQDGHEVARYRAGQQALFFLEPIAESRELRALAVPGGPTHVSSQEHDELFLIDPAKSTVLLAATKDLVKSERAATGTERVALIRRATLALLTSNDPSLAASALASLVLAPDAALLTTADMPRLEKRLSDPMVSIGFRVGLLAELERRGLVKGPDRWVALLDGASPKELPTAIRAVGMHPYAPVEERLIALLGNPDSPTAVATEAAIALGEFRNEAAVKALADALAKGEPRLRNAAIRGLGRNATPASQQVLEHAAESHPDPATRNRARAELRSGEARRARSDARTMRKPESVLRSRPFRILVRSWVRIPGALRPSMLRSEVFGDSCVRKSRSPGSQRRRASRATFARSHPAPGLNRHSHARTSGIA
jgi:hypothetical protein